MQRDHVSDALWAVSAHQPACPLARLAAHMGTKEYVAGPWKVNLHCATRATLHQGTTKLSIQKELFGSTTDCYAFVPYELDEGAELNVLEVHGLAVLQWHEEELADILYDAEEGVDVNAEGLGVEQVDAGHEQLHAALAAPDEAGEHHLSSAKPSKMPDTG